MKMKMKTVSWSHFMSHYSQETLSRRRSCVAFMLKMMKIMKKFQGNIHVFCWCFQDDLFERNVKIFESFLRAFNTRSVETVPENVWMEQTFRRISWDAKNSKMFDVFFLLSTSYEIYVEIHNPASFLLWPNEKQ